jgi:hypothetical protein
MWAKLHEATPWERVVEVLVNLDNVTYFRPAGGGRTFVQMGTGRQGDNVPTIYLHVMESADQIAQLLREAGQAIVAAQAR